MSNTEIVVVGAGVAGMGIVGAGVTSSTAF